MRRLREVIEQLEAGNLSLEDSLKMYEEGVALARRGHRVLDRAEKRVEILVRDGRDGPMTEAPLDPTGSPTEGYADGQEEGQEEDHAAKTAGNRHGSPA